VSGVSHQENCYSSSLGMYHFTGLTFSRCRHWRLHVEAEFLTAEALPCDHSCRRLPRISLNREAKGVVVLAPTY
jgi:hypothetical protein